MKKSKFLNQCRWYKGGDKLTNEFSKLERTWVEANDNEDQRSLVEWYNTARLNNLTTPKDNVPVSLQGLLYSWFSSHTQSKDPKDWERFYQSYLAKH